MITVPTTLVLGAGASMPYGFPSGWQLRQWLCDPRTLEALHTKFNREDIEIFCREFLHSGMKSIDAFLSRRGAHSLTPPYRVSRAGLPTFGDIGKAAIALKLVECEKHAALFSPEKDHWYEYLWSLVSDSLENFGENRLSIVIFNYDRSLEQYLLTALQNAFGITDIEAAQHLKKIPIIHVYGQLAELPVMCDKGKESRFYSPDVSDPAYIAAAARGIRVIAESRDDDSLFQKAYECLENSEKICFLGFGFDSINVKRLRINELLKVANPKTNKVRHAYATTVGLEKAEREKVRRLLTFVRNEISFDSHIDEFANMKSEQYLKATGALN